MRQVEWEWEGLFIPSPLFTPPLVAACPAPAPCPTFLPPPFPLGVYFIPLTPSPSPSH